MTNAKPKQKRGIPPTRDHISVKIDKVRLERLKKIAAVEVPVPTLTGMIERAIAFYLDAVDRQELSRKRAGRPAVRAVMPPVPVETASVEPPVMEIHIADPVESEQAPPVQTWNDDE